MSSGRRITVALVGLVLLAVIGWLATGLDHANRGDQHGGSTAVSTTAG